LRGHSFGPTIWDIYAALIWPEHHVFWPDQGEK